MSFDGKRIKAAAAQAGLTLTDLATHMGVSRATLYAYVANNINPPEERIRQLSQHTGCPVEFFIIKSASEAIDRLDTSLRLVDAMLSSANPKSAAEILESCLDEVPEERRGEWLLRLGNALIMDGSYQDAIPTLQRARQEFQRSEDRPSEGRSLQSLGFCYANVGPLENAALSFEEADHRLREADRWKAKVALAVVAERRGRFDDALKLVARARASASGAGSVLYCRGVKGNILASQGEWRQVLCEELETLSEAEALAATDQIAERLIAIAQASIYLADPKIEFRVAQALGYLQSSQDKARSAYFYTVRSMHALSGGYVADAREHAMTALTGAIKGKYRRAELGANLRLAEASLAERNLEEAAIGFLKAAAYAESYEYASEQDYAEVLAALIYARLGRNTESANVLGRGVTRKVKRGPITAAYADETKAILAGGSWNEERLLAAVSRNVSYLPGITVHR